MNYIIHNYIFVFFAYFFFHSSCRKDLFTVLNLKFTMYLFVNPIKLDEIYLLFDLE